MNTKPEVNACDSQRCNSVGARLALLVALPLVTWQALTPAPVPLQAVAGDKLLHIVVFAGLAFLADRGWPQRPFLMFKALPLALYGLGLEFAQHSLPKRDFSLTDFAADLLGIALYGLLSMMLRRYAHSRA